MKKLILVALLFSANAVADGLYLKGSISMLRNYGNTQTATAAYAYTYDALGFPVMTSFDENQHFIRNRFDRASTCNPYGDGAIGYDRTWGKLNADLSVWHRSGRCNDKGDDGITFSLKWYIF